MATLRYTFRPARPAIIGKGGGKPAVAQPGDDVEFSDTARAKATHERYPGINGGGCLVPLDAESADAIGLAWPLAQPQASTTDAEREQMTAALRDANAELERLRDDLASARADGDSLAAQLRSVQAEVERLSAEAVEKPSRKPKP